MTTQSSNPLLPTEDQPSQRWPAPAGAPHVPAPALSAGLNREIAFTLNGRPVTKVVDVRASLTEVLRDEFGMTSVKKGCEVGECGACTVLIDGESINSCIYLAVWANGKNLRTTEGLATDDGALSLVQQAFVDETAVQCGFCTPGVLLTATELMEERRAFSRDELRVRMAGHLCRCTGYENILRAVESAIDANLERGGAWTDHAFWNAVATVETNEMNPPGPSDDGR